MSMLSSEMLQPEMTRVGIPNEPPTRREEPLIAPFEPLEEPTITTTTPATPEKVLVPASR